MDVLKCIKTRRSIRRFLDVPIPFEYVADIVEAGIEAPSTGNQQSFEFVVITDEETRLKVADACLSQTWIASAPCIVVICTDAKKLERLYGERGLKMYSIQDCACAAQNVLLAANSFDIGSCFVSAFENDLLRIALMIPDHITPQVVIPLGYPDERPPCPAKLDMRDLTFFNNWGEKDISSPWPVVKFIEPTKKSVKSFAEKIKDRIYGKVLKYNKKQQKKANVQEKQASDKRDVNDELLHEDAHYIDNKRSEF